MRSRKKKSRKSIGGKRYIGKPTGLVQDRVKAVGPERFAVITVDCAKRRSKWMLCDFYGKVILEPMTVEHTAGSLSMMVQLAKETLESGSFADSIVAVEMTGIYHKPVHRAFRNAGLDTRIVHPYASNHFRSALHPGDKTDDHDLEAIFHAAIQGYGLATPTVSHVFQALQAVSRHRHRLVKQRSRLMVQMRRLMHMTMPGYADLFEEKLYQRSIALPVAEHFSSAASIREAGVDGIAKYLRESKTRFQTRTIERIVTWANLAAEPCELAQLQVSQWLQLNESRKLSNAHIERTEREMAYFLVKTPYILLLSVTGINVVSAARFAGEAGPIEHYASSRAINGRAGLYPSRYQSDEVDHADGKLIRQCNRQLRCAAMLIAENLIKCHPYYRGLSAVHDTTESARRKSVMLCQRFERRMRQCEAFELRISTRVARTNPFKLTDRQTAPQAPLRQPLKKLPSGSCAKCSRRLHFANSAMTVFSSLIDNIANRGSGSSRHKNTCSEPKRDWLAIQIEKRETKQPHVLFEQRQALEKSSVPVPCSAGNVAQQRPINLAESLKK